MPTTSPERTSSEMPSRSTPNWSARGSRRSFTRSTTSPGWRSWCSSAGGSAPIIIRLSEALVSCCGLHTPVTLPPRSTVQALHSSRISCSLWLMYRMLQPSEASFLSTTNSFSTACGVSTEVGSSRISSLGCGQQRADDLDPLHLAHRQGVYMPGRVDVQAVLGRLGRDALRHLAERQALVHAQPDVLGHRQRVEQAEMLEHHADAQGPRFLRVADVHRLAVPQHAAFVRFDRAVDDLHQRGFAGPVLAQHGMGFAGLHGQ